MTCFAQFDTGFVFDGAQKAVGINLGYSYSSSHEHGISPVMMDRLMGFSENREYGLSPSMLKLMVFKEGEEALLVMDALYELTCEVKNKPVNYETYFEELSAKYRSAAILKAPEVSDFRDTQVDAIWDSNQLAVRVRGADKVKTLQALYADLVTDGFVFQSPGFNPKPHLPRFGLMTKILKG